MLVINIERDQKDLNDKKLVGSVLSIIQPALRRKGLDDRVKVKVTKGKE